MSDQTQTDDIATIHANLKEWVDAKAHEASTKEAFIAVLADMELRLRKIEKAITNEQI